MGKDNLNGLLAEFVDWSKEILAENLAGIYLHGSAVMGCYNPKKSDIDIIIVINDDMTDQVKRAYMDMVVRLHSMAPAKGIEMSIVKKQVCNPFVYPTPFELHFSEAHLQWYMEFPDDYIQKMNGTDKDLAAHFTVICRRGKCLYGLPVEEDGPIYVLEILLYDPDGYFETNEPRLEIAKFEYEDIENFSPGVSPASYYCFDHPLYDVEYEDMGNEIFAAEMPEEIRQKYWGVKRVVCKVELLVDVNYENAYDVIFGTFKILKDK